jgi:hypothetical protein
MNPFAIVSKLYAQAVKASFVELQKLYAGVELLTSA